jgi:hypothetical protein
VYLAGMTSTSRSIAIAMNFAIPLPPKNPEKKKLEKKDPVPVIFVFMMMNYQGFEGIYLTPDQSLYPYEQECLLMEGIEVAILDI